MASIVKGTGNHPNKYLILGEAPGWQEVKAGIPFIGDTGQELNNYLAMNGLSRDMFYIDNTVPYFIQKIEKSTKEKRQKLVADNKRHLIELFNLVKPDWVFAMGTLALTPFIQKIDLEKLHGIPFKYLGEYGSFNILPMYHPAAGLHNTKMMMQILQDMSSMADAVNGKLSIRQIDEVSPTYIELHHYTELSNICAVDTETVNDKAWSIQISIHPNSAMFISADDKYIVSNVAKQLEQCELVILHNAKFDLKILAQLGIHPSEYTDTMHMAYLLGEPQSLKKLAYRHLGIEMDMYSDVVAPATRKKAVEYLSRVANMDWENPPPEIIFDPKKNKYRVKQPQNIKTKVLKLLKKIEADGSINPVEKWKAMDGTEQVEKVLGTMPEGTLADIPRWDAVNYACRDADVTLQLYPILYEKGKQIGLW